MTDEERLALYLDGAMAPAEAEAFEAELEVRPDLSEKAQRWRANDERLRAAFDLPVPEGLAARMGLEPAPEPAKVVDLAAARAQRESRRRIPAGWGWAGGAALAASLVAAVTLGLVGNGPSDPFGSEQFQVAMQNVPSQQVAQLGDGRVLTPTLTFADGSGRYCREFALAGQEPQIGIACRSGAHWTVEGIAPGAPPGPGNEIRTAGGEGAGLDPLYERLDAGDPLDPGRERDLISRGWE
jgi:hypothetical protein